MLKFFKNEQSKISAADDDLNEKKFEEIKVIGAGLPRTGTLSLKTALTQLYGGEESFSDIGIQVQICINDDAVGLSEHRKTADYCWLLNLLITKESDEKIPMKV